MAACSLSAWKIIPQFCSTSIPRTIVFYTKSLYFTLGGTANTAPTFCSVFIGKKADANIYSFQTKLPFSGPNEANDRGAGEDNWEIFHPSSTMIALGTTELDEYYNILVEEGKVKITEPIEDKQWGYRQFTLEEPDGNEITFF